VLQIWRSVVDDPVASRARPAPPDLTIAADRSIVRPESAKTNLLKRNCDVGQAAAARPRRLERVGLLTELGDSARASRAREHNKSG
jgi:hypothetical protein